MTNASEYKKEVSKFAAEGHALFLKNATPEEIASYNFDNSPEGQKAEAERSKAALALRFAQAEAERVAKKKAKEQARRDRKAAAMEA